MALTLTTRSAIKEWLGISSTTYDTLIDNIGDRAESRILSLCNRPDGFASGSKTEYFDGENADRIVLTNTPVTAISTVQALANGSVVDTLQSTEYTVDQNSGALGLDLTYTSRWLNGRQLYSNDYGTSDGLRLLKPNFPHGWRNIKVVYTGGYATIPGDLAQACIEYAAFMFRARSINPALASHTLGQHSWTVGPEGFTTFEKYLTETWLRNYIKGAIGV